MRHDQLVKCLEKEVRQLLEHQDGHRLIVRSYELPDSVAALVCPTDREIVLLVDPSKPDVHDQALILMREFGEIDFNRPGTPGTPLGAPLSTL